MSVTEFAGVFTSLMLFASLFMVVIQLKAHTEQRKLDSLTKLYDVNRELIALGFKHPQLFDILMDEKNADPIWERRYLQLWFNQLSLIHAYQRRGLYPSELPEDLETDVRDFMTMDNMRRHWSAYGRYYSTSFRAFVDRIVNESEKPAGK